MEEKHPNDWDFYDYLMYIKIHYHKFLLLLLAIIIIIVVDYITNINALMFTIPSPIPGVPGTTNVSVKIKKNKNKK
jgi:MFS superfamily sulfate permease-like transporter